jgi:hypothetical protein
MRAAARRNSISWKELRTALSLAAHALETVPATRRALGDYGTLQCRLHSDAPSLVGAVRQSARHWYNGCSEALARRARHAFGVLLLVAMWRLARFAVALT